MKTAIEISDSAKMPPAMLKLIKTAVAAVLDRELKDVAADRESEISIALVSAAKIRRINKQYRQIDRATDVLSFEGDDAGSGGGRPRMLGELAICPAVVKIDAKESGVSVERELAWVAIHGTLHLLGYDHEKSEALAKTMRQKEEYYLSQLKLR